MSARALNWAWSQTTRTTSQKLVLAALADRADDDGYCWPSTAWLSVKCAPMPAETVRRVLRELCAQELLLKARRQRRNDGTYSTWLFQLPLATSTTATGHERPLVTDDHDHRSPVSAPPVTGERTEPSNEPSKVFGSTDVEPRSPTQTIVAEFVDSFTAIGVKTPKRVVGQLAQAVKRLIDDDVTPDEVRAGITRMVERRVIQPSLLPNFVIEAAAPRGQPATRYGRGMTTKQILEATRQP